MASKFTTAEQVKNIVNAALTKVKEKGYVVSQAGKGLSTEDYTTADKTKLSGLDNAILECEDVTNDTTYDVKFQLYQGKPRLVYEEKA